jgi:hypothetical protein
MEKVCDAAHITLNKNAVFGDASALAPGTHPRSCACTHMFPVHVH